MRGVEEMGRPTKCLGLTALIDGQIRPFDMDRDGRNKKALTERRDFIYGLNTSLDGNRICWHELYHSIFIVNAYICDARRVNDDHPFQFLPIGSLDGKWIAYLSGEHYNREPHLARADGTGLRKLGDPAGDRGVVEQLDEPDSHSEPSDILTRSPDGRWLQFTPEVVRPWS
jgi:hypothetical protein